MPGTSLDVMAQKSALRLKHAAVASPGVRSSRLATTGLGIVYKGRVIFFANVVPGKCAPFLLGTPVSPAL
jgi:hypothetical protein